MQFTSLKCDGEKKTLKQGFSVHYICFTDLVTSVKSNSLSLSDFKWYCNMILWMHVTFWTMEYTFDRSGCSDLLSRYLRLVSYVCFCSAYMYKYCYIYNVLLLAGQINSTCSTSIYNHWYWPSYEEHACTWCSIGSHF